MEARVAGSADCHLAAQVHMRCAEGFGQAIQPDPSANASRFDYGIGKTELGYGHYCLRRLGFDRQFSRTILEEKIESAEIARCHRLPGDLARSLLFYTAIEIPVVDDPR